MPGQALSALVESASRTVETAGFEWKIEAVSSREFALVSSNYLLHFEVDADTRAEIAAMANPVERQQKIQEVSLRVAAALTPLQLAEKTESGEQLVCAGVRAFRIVGAPDWDPVEFVMNRGEEIDTSKWVPNGPEWMQVVEGKRPPPRKWVGRLSRGTIGELFTAIWNLSGDDGRAEERIAHFRGQSAGDAPGGRDRAPSREVGA